MKEVKLNWNSYKDLDSIPVGFIYLIVNGLNAIKTDVKTSAGRRILSDDEIRYDIYAAEINDKEDIEGIRRFLNEFFSPVYVSYDPTAEPIKVNIPIGKIN